MRGLLRKVARIGVTVAVAMQVPNYARSNNAARDLRKACERGKGWPAPYAVECMLWDRHDGEKVMEVLEFLVRRGARVNLEEVHITSGESLAHLKRILSELKRAAIA